MLELSGIHRSCLLFVHGCFFSPKRYPRTWVLKLVDMKMIGVKKYCGCVLTYNFIYFCY